MELGPSGFPFEKFVSYLFKERNYNTKIGVIVEGKCVSHEIDVWAESKEKLILVECKYKNNQTTKSNVQTPSLYKISLLRY